MGIKPISFLVANLVAQLIAMLVTQCERTLIYNIYRFHQFILQKTGEHRVNHFVKYVKFQNGISYEYVLITHVIICFTERSIVIKGNQAHHIPCHLSGKFPLIMS